MRQGKLPSGTPNRRAATVGWRRRRLGENAAPGAGHENCARRLPAGAAALYLTVTVTIALALPLLPVHVMP